MSGKGVKLAVSGKGGVGKTTVAAMLVRHLAASNRRVLAVDADPVPSLAGALGIASPTEPVAKMHDLIFERTGAKPGTLGGFFKMNPKVNDIPERFASVSGSVHLIVMGTVDKGGSGCVCPESVLLKNLVQHLVLFDDDALVMDMEAGVEHLGRATARAVDLMLVVVEPGGRSLEAARMVKRLAGEIGLERVAAVANKLRGKEDLELIRRALAGELPLLGGLEFDNELVEADLSGRPPYAGQMPGAASRLMASIMEFAGRVE